MSLRREPLVVAAMAVLGVILACAILGPWIAPWPPGAISLSARLVPPAWLPAGRPDHLLGTDQLGRDVLSRIIAGSRVSLAVAGLVVILGGAVGTAAGVAGGYAGGRLDSLIMRVVDVQVAFPGLLLAMLMLAVIGPSLGTLVLVLAFSGWMVFARLARSVTLSLRRAPYVEAAELLGCSPSPMTSALCGKCRTGSRSCIAAGWSKCCRRRRSGGPATPIPPPCSRPSCGPTRLNAPACWCRRPARSRARSIPPPAAASTHDASGPMRCVARQSHR